MKSTFTATSFASKFFEEVTREHFALAQEGAEEVAQEILQDAKAHAPVKTGTLKGSARSYKGKSRSSKGSKFRNYNEIKLTFGVRRRKRKKGKRDRGRADYASAVHAPTMKLRSGERQWLYKAVGRKQHKIPAIIGAKWRRR